jgi:DNA-binding GntR family transcriptional regulator
MPARDALKQLLLEGFVAETSSGRSYVASFSGSDLHDIYDIEGALHGLAAKHATERQEPGELDNLRGIHQEMLAIDGKDEERLARLPELNYEFHRMVNRMARSSRLRASLRTHSLSIPRDYIIEIPGYATRANGEHGAILEAMAAGEAEKAGSLMTCHISDAADDLVTFLTSRGVDLG